MKLLGRTEDKGYIVELSLWDMDKLCQLANEDNKSANTNTRDKFYNCDCFGCANCKKRGVCWSVEIANEILKDCKELIE